MEEICGAPGQASYQTHGPGGRFPSVRAACYRLVGDLMTVNGSHFTMTTHDQPHSLKGSDTSGRNYEGVGITRAHDSGSFVNGHAVSTLVNNFYMIGKAGAPSFKTHETFHVTVTPSGHITAHHDSLRVTCG